MTAREPINLSALNQYAYCPRRCGLIYLEGEFADNVHTARGNAEHEHVDRIAHITVASGVRVEYALPVWSERLDLVGRCDVVEFWPNGTVLPVEHKHGARKRWVNDDVQVAAQAICLEEMLGRPVNAGAVYHSTSRRRREVAVTLELTQLVAQIVDAIRAMLESGVLPAPIVHRRCRECSLKEVCQPEAVAAVQRLRDMRREFFDASKE